MDAFLRNGYQSEAASGLYEEMMENWPHAPNAWEAVDTDVAPRLCRNNAYRKVRICPMNIFWDAEKYKKDFSFVPQYGEAVIDLLDAAPGPA